MAEFTSLEDYNNGFSDGEVGSTAELLKAMQAGQITGRDTADQDLTIEPLKAESLEKTLKLLDFRTKDIRLLNAMPKMTAYNTVEEFLQLKSYGTDRGGFYNEGELSDVEDSTYVRRSELIKYIQVTGEVTMQAQMVRTFYDAYKKEVENKTMWVMRKANSAMTKGDADIVPQQFNGLFKQHANIGSGGGLDYLYADLETYMTSDVVIDKRGESLTQFDIENAAVVGDGHYATFTDLFAPTSAISALIQDYFKIQRLIKGNNNGTVGVTIPAIDTSMGSIKLSSDKFMKADSTRLLTDGATSPKAPAVPTISSQAVEIDSKSKVTAADAGSRYYAVATVNRYGESVLVQMSAYALAMVAGYSAQLGFDVSSEVGAPTGFRIYSTKVTTAGANTGLKFYPLFYVSRAQRNAGYDGAAANYVWDRARFLPGMEQAFMTQMDEEVMSFKQLAPISKLDLAIISMSKRFIAFNFCCPNLYAPQKMVRFVNCSPTLNVSDPDLS